MDDGKGSRVRTGKRMSLVTNGMMGNAPRKKMTAGECMSATNVRKQGIKGKTVESREMVPSSVRRSGHKTAKRP